MTGDTTLGEGTFWIEDMLLLRISVGVFVLDRGNGMSAGKAS